MRVKKLEIHLSEGCNLRCANCSHFSPIAEEEYLNPIDYENNIMSIGRDVLNSFDKIHLLGGEPLLNTSIEEIIEITRRYYDNEIFVVSNGILLKAMPYSFFRCCEMNKVKLTVTEYPIKVDYKAILKHLKKRYPHLNVGFYNHISSFGVNKIDVNGTQDKDANFGICKYPNEFRCFQLIGTKLYICPHAAYIRHFNKRYGYNLEDKEYLDLSKVSNNDEIDEWASKSKDFCKHCIINYSKREPWRLHEEGQNDYL